MSEKRPAVEFTAFIDVRCRWLDHADSFRMPPSSVRASSSWVAGRQEGQLTRITRTLYCIAYIFYFLLTFNSWYYNRILRVMRVSWLMRPGKSAKFDGAASPSVGPVILLTINRADVTAPRQQRYCCPEPVPRRLSPIRKWSERSQSDHSSTSFSPSPR